LPISVAQTAAVQKILRLMAAETLQETFAVEVSQIIAVRLPQVEEMQRLLREACAGKIVIAAVEAVL